MREKVRQILALVLCMAMLLGSLQGTGLYASAAAIDESMAADVQVQAEEEDEGLTDEDAKPLAEAEAVLDQEPERVDEVSILQQGETEPNINLPEEEPETTVEPEADKIEEKTARDEMITLSGTEYQLLDYLTGDIEIWVAETDKYGDPINTTWKKADSSYVYTNCDYIRLYLSYNVPSGITADDELVYQIPDFMGTFLEKSGEIVDSNYGNSGTYTIDSTGKVTIKFDSAYLESGKINGGEFSFEGTLNVTADSSGETKLVFGDYEVDIKVNTKAELAISKAGEITVKDAEGDTTTVEYSISVTAPATNCIAIENVTVKDKFSVGAGYVKGYQFTGFTQSGDVWNNGADTVTVSTSEKSFEWALSAVKPGETRILTYTVTIDKEIWLGTHSLGYSKEKLTNKAELFIDGITENSVTKTLEFTKRYAYKSLSHTNADGNYEYRVYTNYSEEPLKDMDGAELTDVITGGTIVGKVKVVRVSYVDGERVSDDSWSDTIDADGESSFTYTFGPGQYGYQFSYVVKPDEKAGSVSNTVTVKIDSKEYHYTASKGETLAGTKKYVDHYVEDGYLYMNWVITATQAMKAGYSILDYFDSEVSFVKYQSVVAYSVYDKDDNELIEGQDWELYTAAGNANFGIKLLKDFEAGLKMKTTTRIALTDLEKASINGETVDLEQGVKIYNKARFATDTSGSDPIYVSDSFKYYDWYSLGKDLPADFYDADKQTITWELTVNKAGTMDGTVYILEELPEGLEYVAAEIQSVGDAYNGLTQPTLKTDIVSGADPQQLQMTLKDVVGDKAGKADSEIVIKLVTKILDENFILNGGTVKFRNKANIVNNFTENKPLKSVTCDAEVVLDTLEKAGVVAGSKVTYTIDVNKSRTTLIQTPPVPDMQELYVVDKWSENISVNRDSIKVYKVAEDGTETLVTLGEGAEKLEVDGSAREFKLYLEDATYYKVVYEASISGSIGETVTIKNDITFYGKAEYTITEEKEIVIQKSEASSSSKPNLLIKKYEEGTNNTLEAAEFTLAPVTIDNNAVKWEDELNGVPAIGSPDVKATDTLGTIIYEGLEWNTLYVFWESKVPDGYKFPNGDPYHYVFFSQKTLSEMPEYISDLQAAGAKISIYQSTTMIDVDNAKIPDSVSASFRAAKTLNGREITTGEFSFTAELVSGDPDNVDGLTGSKVTAVNKENGEVVFGPLTYNADGIYIYEISEDKGADSSIEYDTAKYYVKVTVTDAGDGKLKAAVKYYKNFDGTNVSGEITSGIEFINMLKPADAKILKTDQEGNPLAGAKLALYDADGKEVAAWTSTGEAHKLDGLLTLGETYTLKELKAPEGYLLAPAETFTVETNLETITVTMVDIKTTDLYSVEVTKLLKYEEEYRSSEYSFYAALFWDEECTQRATEVKELKLEKSYVTTAVFDKLAAGTYYLAETDADGKVIDGEAFFTNEIINSAIVLPNEATQEQATIINHLTEFPDGFLEKDDGRIEIDKKVVAGKTAKAVTDTFYFTLYSDEAMTNIIATQSLSLKNESEGRVTFEQLAYGTYYIAESDKDGTPVDDDFAYAVSLSDELVTLEDENTVTVEVVNDLGEENGGGNGNNNNGNNNNGKSNNPGGNNNAAKQTVSTSGRTSTIVKTGDDTQMALYLILLLGAAVAITAVTVRRRKQQK